MNTRLFNADNLEILKTLEDNSIDSVVTDPPYGISFFEKKWDYDVPTLEVWTEVLRVLKPGGHALIACGTRTQHRMAVNLEDAGFEIRDIVAWVYGKAMPKSLNVGKEVDKIQGNERQEVEEEHWGRKNRSYHCGHAIHNFKKHVNKEEHVRYTTRTVTKGNSEWEGWGTALKPAMELWTLCRKPLSEKTVAENVLKWGTGALNIEATKIASDNNIKRYPANLIHDGSPEVLELFPNTISKWGTQNKLNKEKHDRFLGKMVNEELALKTNDFTQDYGCAARFFYCAKPSTTEKEKGLDSEQSNTHVTVKPVKLMQYLCKLITRKNGIILDPFMGSGTTGIAAKLEGFNFIGIEKEIEYYNIAKKRIENY